MRIADASAKTAIGQRGKEGANSSMPLAWEECAQASPGQKQPKRPDREKSVNKSHENCGGGAMISMAVELPECQWKLSGSHQVRMVRTDLLCGVDASKPIASHFLPEEIAAISSG